jgi:hypothetical protein
MCSNSSLPWSIFITYDDDFGWLFPYTAPSGGTTIYSGTGTTTVYFQFSNGPYSTGNLIPRSATITVFNDLVAENFKQYTITQNIRTGTSTGNGWDQFIQQQV